MEITITVQYSVPVSRTVPLPAGADWRHVKDWEVRDNTLTLNYHEGHLQTTHYLPIPKLEDIGVTTPHAVRIDNEHGTQLVLSQSPTPAGEFYRVGAGDEVRSGRLVLREATHTENQRLTLVAYDVRIDGEVELMAFDLGKHWLIYQPEHVTPAVDKRLQALQGDDNQALLTGMAIADLLKLARDYTSHTTKVSTTSGDLSYVELARALLTLLTGMGNQP